jgi:hypothetical protein
MTTQYDLALGEVTVADEDGFSIYRRFNGYHFPWKENEGNSYRHGFWQVKYGNGVSDNFTDFILSTFFFVPFTTQAKFYLLP